MPVSIYITSNVDDPILLQSFTTHYVNKPFFTALTYGDVVAAKIIYTPDWSDSDAE